MRNIKWSTIIKLGVASLIVGTILAWVGADPFDFWEGIYHSIKEGVERIFGIGWDGVTRAVRYTIYGAVVVVPIWVVSILLKRRGPRRRGSDDL